jgi:hypothetical protein
MGTVSGTELSFDLRLLRPTFMEHAGAVIGPSYLSASRVSDFQDSPTSRSNIVAGQ